MCRAIIPRRGVTPRPYRPVVLLDPTCAGCGAPGATVCPRGAADLRPAPGHAPPLGVDRWSALLRYDDTARSLLTSLKNGYRRDLVGWLADRMADLTGPAPASVVTWAPTTAQRRRTRGFDQAELLARSLARRWALPCRALLQRRPGDPQAGRSGTGRRAHPGFRAVSGVPEGVLVVDDVATTGATLTAAARALRGAGAQRVEAMVAARTRD